MSKKQKRNISRRWYTNNLNQKKVCINEEKENFVRKERRSDNTERRLYFENVDEDKISASYKNGLLMVNLPKKKIKDKKGKSIAIE